MKRRDIIVGSLATATLLALNVKAEPIETFESVAETFGFEITTHLVISGSGYVSESGESIPHTITVKHMTHKGSGSLRISFLSDSMVVVNKNPIGAFAHTPQELKAILKRELRIG